MPPQQGVPSKPQNSPNCLANMYGADRTKGTAQKWRRHRYTLSCTRSIALPYCPRVSTCSCLPEKRGPSVLRCCVVAGSSYNRLVNVLLSNLPDGMVTHALFDRLCQGMLVADAGRDRRRLGVRQTPLPLDYAMGTQAKNIDTTTTTVVALIVVFNSSNRSIPRSHKSGRVLVPFGNQRSKSSVEPYLTADTTVAVHSITFT